MAGVPYGVSYGSVNYHQHFPHEYITSYIMEIATVGTEAINGTGYKVSSGLYN